MENNKYQFIINSDYNKLYQYLFFVLNENGKTIPKYNFEETNIQKNKLLQFIFETEVTILDNSLHTDISSNKNLKDQITKDIGKYNLKVTNFTINTNDVSFNYIKRKDENLYFYGTIIIPNNFHFNMSNVLISEYIL
jgi:hypothetical protein